MTEISSFYYFLDQKFKLFLKYYITIILLNYTLFKVIIFKESIFVENENSESMHLSSRHSYPYKLSVEIRIAIKPNSRAALGQRISGARLII